MSVSRRYAVLLAALTLATLVPSLAAYRQVSRYAAIPLFQTGPPASVSIDSAVSDVKVFGAGVALGVERERRRITLLHEGGRSSPVPNRAPGEAPKAPWAAAAHRGTVWVLDQDTGAVHVYDGDAHVFSRSVTEPGRRELAADGEGRLLFGEDSSVCRLTPDLERDSSFGKDGCAPAVAPEGIASVGARVLVTGGADEILVLDAGGRLVARRRALGNVGRLGRGGAGRALMVDRITGRLWLLDENGVEVGRIASSRDLPAVMADILDVDFDGRVLWVTGPWATNVYRPAAAR
jgi:hypothetical protein